MTIEEICEQKQQELLDKYFSGISHDIVTGSPETIGENTKDLPLKIEDEYRKFLEELWPDYAPEEMRNHPLVFEEQKLCWLMTEDDREAVDEAYEQATRITLWERITKSNHKDVAHYKALLREYTKELLMIMRLDFLEEITGKHIRNKTFEPD